mmetsp:Transcript_43418/g.102174  ORF Transcript_43418/g.102174 Transcript_43418/m.102174 type:complete len:201 (+) Transcript_43418:158-760(+)
MTPSPACPLIWSPFLRPTKRVIHKTKKHNPSMEFAPPKPSSELPLSPRSSKFSVFLPRTRRMRPTMPSCRLSTILKLPRTPSSLSLRVSTLPCTRLARSRSIHVLWAKERRRPRRTSRSKSRHRVSTQLDLRLKKSGIRSETIVTTKGRFRIWSTSWRSRVRTSSSRTPTSQGSPWRSETARMDQLMRWRQRLRRVILRR